MCTSWCGHKSSITGNVKCELKAKNSTTTWSVPKQNWSKHKTFESTSYVYFTILACWYSDETFKDEIILESNIKLDCSCTSLTFSLLRMYNCVYTALYSLFMLWEEDTEVLEIIRQRDLVFILTRIYSLEYPRTRCALWHFFLWIQEMMILQKKLIIFIIEANIWPDVTDKNWTLLVLREHLWIPLVK